MLVFNYCHAGKHPLTRGIGTQHCDVVPFEHGLSFLFFLSQNPILPPHSQTLSGGVVWIFGPDPKRQFRHLALSMPDRGGIKGRMYFWGMFTPCGICLSPQHWRLWTADG